MATQETRKMLAVAAEAADSKKAEDIRILELDPTESALTDYFLICTGTNDRQNVAIADEIDLQIKRKFNTLPNSVEGRRQGEWILMDYVDFIVHIFLPERREFYGLERLKKSATSLTIEELNALLKGKVQQMRTRTPAKKTPAKRTVAKKATAKAVEKIFAPKAVAKKSTVKKAIVKKTAKKVASNRKK